MLSIAKAFLKINKDAVNGISHTQKYLNPLHKTNNTITNSDTKALETIYLSGTIVLLVNLA